MTSVPTAASTTPMTRATSIGCPVIVAAATPASPAVPPNAKLRTRVARNTSR